MNVRNKTYDLIVSALLAAILFVAQVCLSFLPNIELVSVLIIVYSLTFSKRQVIPTIFIFCILEGLIYGFSLWWITYLYIWPILMLVTLLLKKNRSVLFWATIAAMYGLCFGALCALIYVAVGNFKTAFAFWISGIPFDLLHCGGNFVTTLLLFKPLMYVLGRCNGKIENLKK
ncbi:MAG: hypothetical protein RR902_03865 [Oscillospiraceae bacterium]